jgi:hypothetical protein
MKRANATRMTATRRAIRVKRRVRMWRARSGKKRRMLPTTIPTIPSMIGNFHDPAVQMMLQPAMVQGSPSWSIMLWMQAQVYLWPGLIFL